MPTTDQIVAALRKRVIAGELNEARWGLQKLLSREPDHEGVIALEALLAHRTGNTSAALSKLRLAVRRFPHSALLHATLAQASAAVGDTAGALAESQEAVRLDSNSAAALLILTNLLMSAGRFDECDPFLQQLLTVDPQNAEAWNRQACCNQSRGLLAEADQAFRRSIQLDPHAILPSSNRALLSNYRDDLAPCDVFAIHRDWLERHAATAIQLPQRTNRKAGRIRIGYVSPDFRSHSVATFFEPVIRNHDRSEFEVTCYASLAAEDQITRRLRGFAEHWCDIRPLPDRAAAEKIRADDIDILVDLAGHTGSNRLPIFALRPASMQVTWMGYPNTTGLSQIDYRFTDAAADPTDESQTWHSEKLVRLPGTFFCYYGPAIQVEPGNPEPASDCRGDGLITFSVPTNVQKIRPRVIHAWAAILKQLPNSRIAIFAQGVDSAFVRDWILREFAQAGVHDRVELHGTISFLEYMRSHDGWDLALDTSPFNGHTTTCHALWMGVPVVTLAGQMHAGRMGASVLRAIGLDNLVADSVNEYVEIAVKLAGDVERRRALRRELRDRMKSSAMMNGKTFTAGLEEVYKRLFASHT